VSLPLSRSQLVRLGERLVAADPPAVDDLAQLYEVLRAYDAVPTATVARVRAETGIVPTSRIKNTGTILEKLGRYGGSWLKSIQDLAGMRIVLTGDRDDQDRLVQQLVTLFGDDRKPPTVVDRRAEPSHGCRAVHIIVLPNDLPVEIQVRTRLQHEWAELWAGIRAYPPSREPLRRRL